jgi:cation:H+ antiporter
VVGISAVTVVGSADLATADVLGSCAFNLLILSTLDLFLKGQSLFSRASSTHIMAGTMGIILVSMAGLGLFLTEDITVTSWIGFISIAFIIGYVLAMRIIYAYQKTISMPGEKEGMETALNEIPLSKAVALYLLNAIIVIGAALFLPGFAEEIAKSTGLGVSFVGTLFLAASTSFPEMAVSYSALRAGSVDMAVGNLLGSNLFNILILAIDDIFYTKGHLLKDASDLHIISVFSVVIMTAIAISGLAYHNKQKKKYLMAADTLLILFVYIVNLTLLYTLTR